jgi:hypothetical protein
MLPCSSMRAILNCFVEVFIENIMGSIQKALRHHCKIR